MLQVAKKASVLKRRKSRNKMEPPPPPPPQPECNNRRESEGDVVFYIEEPKAGESIGNPNRIIWKINTQGIYQPGKVGESYGNILLVTTVFELSDWIFFNFFS